MRAIRRMRWIGTLAAVVPLLIFLLTRDTVRKVAFSTLRFFAGTSSTLLKRKRWHEMLLLAMRMALCGLLAHKGPGAVR